MDVGLLEQAIELVEKANVDLQPELLAASSARRFLTAYARLEKLAAFGVAALTRKIDAPGEVARLTGTSMGKAQTVVATGKVLADSAPLAAAMQRGEISFDQAAEIASVEESVPGAAGKLLETARDSSFHVLKEQCRGTKLEAEQHRDLSSRQHAARSARSHRDTLGMIHIDLTLEPHVGAPIVARAEAEARRLTKAARKTSSREEPFECHLADAYAGLLSGKGKPHSKRPELVVLVSHEVAKRGWKSLKKGETCKIPGIGPVAPAVAKEIAQDAFLTGVFYDGKDLRTIKRWTRSIPVEVALALELGDPPDFDGVKCVDCGNRFRSEFDHVVPRANRGPTSLRNLKPRCHRCHKVKSERDRRVRSRSPAADP